MHGLDLAKLLVVTMLFELNRFNAALLLYSGIHLRGERFGQLLGERFRGAVGLCVGRGRRGLELDLIGGIRARCPGSNHQEDGSRGGCDLDHGIRL